jgi:hypothetical protein
VRAGNSFCGASGIWKEQTFFVEKYYGLKITFSSKISKFKEVQILIQEGGIS